MKGKKSNKKKRQGGIGLTHSRVTSEKGGCEKRREGTGYRRDEEGATYVIRYYASALLKERGGTGAWSKIGTRQKKRQVNIFRDASRITKFSILTR